MIAPEVVVRLELMISKPPLVLARVPPLRVKLPVPLTAAVIALKVTRPEPEMFMFPTELRFPVGSTVVPPEIVRVVPALNAPAPEYVVAGVIVIAVADVTFAAADTEPVEAVTLTDPADDVTGCEIVADVPVKVTFPGAVRSSPIEIVPPEETKDR